MLKSVDYSGNQGSIFICDKCKKEILTNKETRFRMQVQGFFKTNYPSSVNKFDLCEKCYINLCNYIKKER